MNASGGSPATATGCLDRDGITDFKSAFLAAGELDDASITALEILRSVRTSAPAFKTVGTLLSVLSDEADFQCLSCANASNHAIATMPVSDSPRASSDFEPLERDRVARFEGLWVRDARVGHVSVNRIGPIRVPGRPRASGDRFVVAERLIPEKQIVHGSLTAGGEFEGKHERVRDAL